MIRAVRRSIARKLLVAVGIPSALFAALGVAWLWRETRPLSPGLERVAIVAVLLFGAAVTAVHFVAVRYVVERPLQRLAFGMRRARDGDFLYRVRTGGIDELAGLAAEFNGTLVAITDLNVRRIEDAASMESMQRELALKAELEAQHRLVDEANRRLEERVRELTLLSDLSRTLGSTLELDALLGAIGDRLGRTPGLGAFQILLAEPSGDLVVRGASGADPQAIGLAVKRGEGPAGQAAAERRVVLVRDAAGAGLPVRRGAAGSILAVPMSTLDEVVGVLEFLRPAGDAFPEDEIRLLQAVAAQAAMAVANARLHGEMVRLSLTDPLTGAPNRRSLFARLGLELARCERFGQPLGIAIADVDRFGRYNGARGRSAGDALLRRVGEILQAHVRRVDLVARYAGEEFAVVLPHADQAAALQACEQLRHAVESAALDDGEGGRVTISVGLAAWPEDGRELAALIDCADAALYAAKRAGRNAVRAHSPGMREHPGRERDVRVTADAER
ncbi:MAG TPA: diguanylate cyclase [Anaeromyxobacteraceae bacterium]|nr:diguanylate cyclase [Anaeromyxobacteraceae bacterium]